MIHFIISKGIGICFCWVPSHCGIFWNEAADRLAKIEAFNNSNTVLNEKLPLSAKEMYSLLEHSICTKASVSRDNFLTHSRSITSLVFKIRLNSWITKYTDVSCICSQQLSIHNLLLECPILLSKYQMNDMDFHQKYNNTKDILNDKETNFALIAKVILSTPIGRLL